MKRAFRKVNGDLVDLITHSTNVIKEHPHTKIYVGTDSQNKGDYTIYVITVAYRYNTRGVHFIYHKEKVPRIKDSFSRLFKEAEFSIEVAEYLRKNSSLKIEAIDMDYNAKKTHKSNIVVNAAKGWAEGLGYKVIIKPGEQIAVRASDLLCR